MILELTLAMLANVKDAAVVFSIIGIVFGIFLVAIVTFSSESEMNEKTRTKVQRGGKTLLVIGIVCLPFALVPTIDDLWKVRIGLIKLELSSEENIQKAATEIERLGKKLECKYLGGCEKDE